MLVALVLLSGCAPESGSKGGSAFEVTSARTYGPEDKRIAARLSLGNGSQLDAESSPYEQALMCQVAFADVAERLQEAGTLPSEQLRAMETAREVLDRRLASFAKSAGKSEAAVRQDVEAREAAQPTPGESMRIVIGCLRKLQEDARA